MAAENFEHCLAFTLHYEGGLSNDPRDPGGRTQEGVTQLTYSTWLAHKGRQNADVARISNADRDAIYREEYWDRIHGDRLRLGEDLVVFDFAVNSGPHRAVEFWNNAGGLQATAVDVINKISAKRLSFLQSLKTWRFFGPGWSKRVIACHQKALAMAAAPLPVPPVPTPIPPSPIPPPPSPVPPAPPRPVPVPGTIATVLDQLLAIQASCEAELTRVGHEKAVIDHAITELATIRLTPGTVPQIPDDQLTMKPKKVKEMLGTNWKTNTAGIATLFGAASAILTSIGKGQIPDPTELSIIISAITTGVGLLAAKDKNVTGGDVPQTNEAKRRVSA
jgi:lysozyme family protein